MSCHFDVNTMSCGRLAGLPAGVTGTRGTVTVPQRLALGRLLAVLLPPQLHHGDCTGADAEAHMAAWTLGIRLVVHPPASPRFRAFCNPLDRGEVREPAPYLARNRAIVREVSLLITVPAGARPASTAGSGTWTTVGYAEKAGLPVFIISPGGTVTVDRMPDGC